MRTRARTANRRAGWGDRERRRSEVGKSEAGETVKVLPSTSARASAVSLFPLHALLDDRRGPSAAWTSLESGTHDECGRNRRVVVSFIAVRRWAESSRKKKQACGLRRPQRAEAEIHQLNAHLEDRVAARTAELEAVNNELEAFAYSVSHDLRAPLRAIDGFSAMVIEDSEGKRDEADLGHLQRVRDAAQRMAALIDDLLGLSRVGRQGMQPATVDVPSRDGPHRSRRDRWQGARILHPRRWRWLLTLATPSTSSECSSECTRLMNSKASASAWRPSRFGRPPRRPRLGRERGREGRDVLLHAAGSDSLHRRPHSSFTPNSAPSSPPTASPRRDGAAAGAGRAFAHSA